jgi:cadmium resistance protein CadD (predicted permease)
VAAVTVANGSDNIGIYVPLFASTTFESILIILCVFFLLLGVWCYTAYKLAHQPVIAQVLARYVNTLVPFVLIGLGIFIVLESGSLSPLKLVASCLCLIILVKNNVPKPEMDEN